MVDLIDRQAVQEMVDRIGDIHPYRQIGNRESYSQYNEAWTDAINRVDAELNSLPSADIDLSDFSDKLWNTAYERGKAEAVRHGRWIYDRLITTTGGTYGVRRCSECESYYQDVGYGFNYCPHCGALMDEVAQ